MSMAKAIFTRDFNYTSRIRNAGWAVKAGPQPQSFPRELIEAAVRAGRAREVPPARARRGRGPRRRPTAPTETTPPQPSGPRARPRP